MVISKIMFLYLCLKEFSWSGLRFILDLFIGKMVTNHSSEVHFVRYNGRKLYYRTKTTDIPLIILIILGVYRKGKIVSQYDFGEMGIQFGNVNVLDLGANIGLFSIKYSKYFPDANIVAIEPEDDNFRILKMNTSAYKNIRIKKCGVWWRTANLLIEEGKGAFDFRCKEFEEGRVKGISIDDICEEFGVIPQLVKMDIEGSEKDIFLHLDFCQWIDKMENLIIETHERMVAGSDMIVRAEMAKRGYLEEKYEEDYLFSKKNAS